MAPEEEEEEEEEKKREGKGEEGGRYTDQGTTATSNGVVTTRADQWSHHLPQRSAFHPSPSPRTIFFFLADEDEGKGGEQSLHPHVQPPAITISAQMMTYRPLQIC